MDLARIIQIYVVQLGAGGIYFLFIAFLILRRSTKRINQILSLFFITVASGTVINVIYAALTMNPLVMVLHLLTYYLFCFGLIFLLIFSLMLLKSNRIVNSTKQFLLIGIFALLLSGCFIIGMNGGVTIDASTNWKPVWNLTFFLYAFFVCLGMAIIPTTYFSLKIYSRLENEEIKVRFRYYLIGIWLYYFVWGGTSISNFINDSVFRTIWSLLSLFALISTYTIYYGVGKQF